MWWQRLLSLATVVVAVEVVVAEAAVVAVVAFTFVVVNAVLLTADVVAS